MKSFIILGTVIILSFQTIYSQSYGLGNNSLSNFSRYKIPDTKLSILNLGGNLYFRSAKRNIDESMVYDDSYSSNFSTTLSPKYYYLNESDDNLISLNANSTLGYEKDKAEDATKYVQESKNLYIDVILDSKNYFYSKHNLYYSLYSKINVSMAENEREDKHDYVNSKYVNGNKHQSYQVGIGIGFGRLRNVTPVISALRLQERMKQINLITDNLSDEQIFTLSQSFARKSYYESAYERSGKYFWKDVFSSAPPLQDKLNSLNPYAMEYLKETTQELRVIRREGYFVQADLLFDYNNNYSLYDSGTPDLNNRSTQILEQFYIKPGLSAAYGKQLNLESQILIYCVFAGGPNVTKDSDVKQKYNLNINGTYNYELTDRLITAITFDYAHSITNGPEKVTNKRLSAGLSFNYFIEDNIALNLNYHYQKSIYDDNSGKYDIDNNSLSVGFNYFFNKSILF